MSWYCGDRSCPTYSSPEHQCQNWRLAALKAPVGPKASNQQVDVRTVQGALNRLIGAAGSDRLATDGVFTQELEAALKKFQRVALGLGTQDGRVDPGGRT